ncbi:hypothetical protein P8631_09020 [Guyparkeria sp. 1SP6A2]|nr:hypothetical protein [Guyparkeria sp. 1SP6A2]
MTDVICSQRGNHQFEGNATGCGRLSPYQAFQTPRYSFAFILLSGLLVTGIWPIAGDAAGSRSAVEARPGELVLMRAVPARPAARSAPPGNALLVDPSPRSEIEQGLSSLEITDGGYGQVAAGTSSGGASPSSAISQSMNHSLQSVSGQAGQRGGSPTMSFGGTVGAATGSIGSQVTGALSGAGLFSQAGER